MAKKIVIALCLFLLLLFSSLYVIFNFFRVKVANDYTVHNIDTGLNYRTIQAAIDANETLDRHTIFVEKGIYYEHIVVNKSISLIGQNRTTTVIDGNGTGIDIRVIANSVVIKGFTVKNGTTGIYLYRANNSLAMENDVVLNGDAILVYYSGNCTIYQNSAGNNTSRGILVSNSWNFTVSNNYVYGNGMYGLNANYSTNGSIKQNNAYGNDFDGIGLFDSNNCTITENNVKDNPLYGIMISSSGDSFIYHNNFISNRVQAFDFNLSNRWDNDVEGNYWSDYTGVDSDYDGIGNSSYIIYQDIQDNCPLMGMFYSFNTPLERHVEMTSNSTIKNFEYFQSNNTIRMYVFGKEGMGFCRMCIPTDLMHSPYHIIIDAGLTPVLNNRIVYENGTRKWVYFAYQHSTHEIVITPELLE